MSFPSKVILLLAWIALLPAGLYALEILEADPTLPSRFAGRAQVDEHFGSNSFSVPKDNNYLLGSAWYEESREVVVVFGFRLTEAFLQEWKEQGSAKILFSIIEFHEGDAHKICPIHVEQLAAANTPEEAIALPPQKRLGTILRNDLEEDRLYSYSLTYQPTLKAGDMIWIGLDSTNPLDTENHNLIIAGDISSRPGGAPPIMVVDTPKATSRTVHGMSLLQSLNRCFYAPKSSDKVTDRTARIPRWINPFRTGKKLETLEIFHQTLEQQLAKLPEHPISEPGQFKGFHSSIKPTNEIWKLVFPIRGTQSSIALYPAVRWNGSEFEADAFPKRFKITVIPYEGRAQIMVTDWSETDFPQHGIAPVIFPFKWGAYKEVRMTVYQGVPAQGGHAFALSEVSFPRRYDTFLIPMEVAPEDSIEVPPYWSARYATDGLTAFEATTAPPDSTNGAFRALLNSGEPGQLLICRETAPALRWESFEFHPTRNPDRLPPANFPQRIKIEFSDQNDFSTILRTEQTTNAVRLPNGAQPYVFRFPSINARCARISLWSETGSIQLEEITYNGGLSLKANDKIGECDLSGTPGTSALYDEIINGTPWLPPLNRTVNLLRRAVFSDELQAVNKTILALKKAHADTMALLKVLGIIFAIALFALIILRQRRHAAKEQLRIRHRIQQDLHDEIGSQLSTISLITDANKNESRLPAEVRTELTDANQCAREAVASLTEVIWLTDKKILTLDQCFGVMQKRAMQMVHTLDLKMDFPKKVPHMELSYQAKRNLILLFTEALNNALKHSGASSLQITCTLQERRLVLSIQDDGKGFDLQSAKAGIGLKSMQERAYKLGGKIDITSAPGKGTRICFSGKLPHPPLY